MEPFLLSFFIVFVAELGDKSQLMALTFATRYRALTVLIGISVATLIVHLGSVVLGATVAAALPTALVAILAGAAFFGFAIWTLRGDTLDEAERAKAQRVTGSAVLAVGTAFFLAELGDKTMLATVTLATREDAFWVWIGSTAGMVAADAIAIGIGRLLGTRLPERTVRIGAAAAFVIFGVILVAQGAMDAGLIG